MNWQQAISFMVLGHLVADYTLQGWLADGKQLTWWQKVIPDLHKTRYSKDYIAALACHALYWSILVCLPLYNTPVFVLAIVINSLIHAWVDHLKANKHRINLIQDQLIHSSQILATFVSWAIYNLR